MKNITCKICNREFSGQITGMHLKSHGTTTAEYRTRYGDTQTSEFFHNLLESAKKGGGNQAARDAKHKAKAQRIEKYERHPNRCLQCNDPLSYKGITEQKKFCSHTCSAIASNQNRIIAPAPDKVCLTCNVTFNQKGASKFCSRVCASINQRDRTIKKILAGTNVGKVALRKYLIQRNGYHCEGCTLAEWRGQPIPLEIDHIDGNPKNNLLFNVRMFCCNCHAQTPTYGSKNRGSAPDTQR